MGLRSPCNIFPRMDSDQPRNALRRRYAMPHTPESPKPKYSRVAEVRARYGNASDMWITRKTRDFGFPAPVYFGGRDRFWRDEELDAWDRAMIERATSTPKPVPPSRRKVQS